ncbi:TPA: hypothetical protein QCS32_006197 [Bacillus thuringiensis]|uniref:Uncharacterized protein n=1 Tax=Bacillus thuringiensis serovar iberica TaxID=180866 RepID=A0A9X6LNJ5_BACTU|nr:hypothetical protein [Bacillus thuringiensis]MEB9626008.1 hypothetical protein [Bacillus cereus]OUB51285.1 hypothetical protein BK741_08495 [Bacillus thuringiensis serovar iberica]HDR5354372.1 hypothetical protein [Bacillus thuringiensis]
MERWIAYGRKVSLGIYTILGVLGITYIILGVNNSKYEWTQGHTINGIILFGMFYVLMVLLIRVIMDRKLTKKILLLEIPLAIVIAVGVIASIAFVEEQKIHSLSLFMAVLLVVPVILSLLRIGYSQWKFYKGES